MGRYILVASIAMIACAGMANAKPEHAGHGKNKHDWAANGDPVGYGAGGCPPGLRSKNPDCMPPGQYKKQFEVGQRVQLLPSRIRPQRRSKSTTSARTQRSRYSLKR